MKQIKFETLRLIRSGTLILVVLLSIFIAGLYFLNNHIYKTGYKDHLMHRFSLMVTGVSEDIQYHFKRKGEPVRYDKLGEVAPLKALEEELTKLFSLTEDDTKRDKIPQQILNVYKSYENREKSSIIMTYHEPVLLKKAMIEQNKVLVERKLPYENPELSLTGANLSYITLGRVMGMPLIFLMLFANLNVFGEEHDLGSKKLRLLQPKSWFMMYMSKVIVASLLTLVSIIVLIGSSYLLGGIFGTGFGTFSYPLLVGGGAGGVDATRFIHEDIPVAMMNLSGVMFREIFLFMTYAVLIFAMVQLVSVIVKSRKAILGISAILISIVYWINSKLLFEMQFKFKFIPFPLLGERASKILQFVHNKQLLFFGMNLVFASLVVYLSLMLNKSTRIRDFLIKEKEKSVEITMKAWENSKRSKIPRIKFELLKMHRKKEILISIILLGILYLGFYQIRWSDYEKIKKDNYYESLSTMKSTIKDKNFAEEEINWQKEQDPQKLAKLNIRKIRRVKELAHGNRGYFQDQFNRETEKINIQQMENVLEKSIEPEISRYFALQSTYFDEFKNLSYKMMYDKESKRAHKSGHMIGNYFYKEGGAILLVGLITVFMTQGFSGEGERRTLKLHLIQPGTRIGIYYSKYVVIILMIAYISLSWIIWLPISAILGDNTDSNYPIPNYTIKSAKDKGESYEKTELVNRWYKKMDNPDMDKTTEILVKYKPVWKSNLRVYIGIIAIGIFTVSFGVLISQFVKGRWSSAIITVLVLVLGFWLNGLSHKKVFGLNPFAWLNPYEMSTGYVSLHYDSSVFTPVFGVGILLAWSVGISLIGYLVFISVKQK